MLQEALNSQTRYFTGEPCKRGHIAERWTRNKTCVECNRECRKKWRKNLTARYNDDPEFLTKRQALGREWQKKNAALLNARRRERRKADPDYRERCNARMRGRNQRASSLKALYGLTLEQFNVMRDAQKNQCAICAVQFEATPHVDHCHKTGKIRGLLCSQCNRGLGCYGDDPDRLRRAADYAEKHR